MRELQCINGGVEGETVLFLLCLMCNIKYVVAKLKGLALAWICVWFVVFSHSL